MENSSATSDWKAGQKILFRFFAVYLTLYMTPLMIVAPILDPLASWAGSHILSLKMESDPIRNGSGDTSLDYAQQFLFIVFSTLACVIWTIADRKRNNYDWLLYRAKVAVRCYLGFFLLVYGYSKFAHSQFPAPSLYRLSQPYGDSSPMGLAWTFLGYSTPYNYFMGFFESIGGLLLLFRRTTLLGACIGAAVLLNIVAINFCFDVPVKLFSSNLFLMSLFIIATSSRRIINFFFLNKPTTPENPSIGFGQKGWRIAGVVVKSIYLVGFAFALLPGGIYAAKGKDVKPPLYGIYVVRSFEEFGNTLPDSLHWSKLVIQDGKTVLEMENKERYRPTFELDTMQRHLKMSISNKTFNLHYKWEDSSVVFYGRCANDSVCIKMQRYDEKKYLLTSRGFHWINEYPFNR